jgi:hypothetical protein
MFSNIDFSASLSRISSLDKETQSYFPSGLGSDMANSF